MSKTVLITGASRGIGRAIALKLAESFDNIIINSVANSKQLDSTKQSICMLNKQCSSYLGDVGDHLFVKEMVAECIAEYGSIDCLVNNAGISYVGLLTDMTIDQWDHIIKTNVTSVFNCCHEVVPYMVSKKSGTIINISSMWGINGASCEVAYSATKGAVNAFTSALAKELAPSGISVNAIACGAIDTDMNKCFSEDEMNLFCEDIPIGRMGKTEEIAETVKLLCDSPKYLTGSIIKIDGGYI